ncbi:MAG: twin-arginine translocase TatA/TatE family subunit [Kiritimatiellae bacterium]|nr:twin-arginine translocase TatA/TatE family subunit [Kiritimatiellia bacterium]
MLAWLTGGAPGWPELLLVILLLVVFFGAKRLPELARSLGKSINEFKRGRQEGPLDETIEKQPRHQDAEQKQKG